MQLYNSNSITGDILYEVDDESDFLYFVGKGHIDLLDSQDKILRSLTPGTMVVGHSN